MPSCLSAFFIGVLVFLLGAEPATAFSKRFQPYYTAEQVSSASPGTLKGQRFNNIAFLDPAGQRKSIADYRGKIVVINFWGAWCPPCRREMPSLAELYGRFKGNPEVQFIFLQIGESMAKSLAYVNREGFDLPVFNSIIAAPRSRRVMLASGGKVGLRDIGIKSYPTTVFLDKNGMVMGRISSNYQWKSWGDSMVDAVRNSLPVVN